MKCEMCGKEASLKKTKVEGAVLKLCKDCQETGNVVETGGSGGGGGRKKNSRKRRRKPRSQQKHLVTDFDKKVKKKREAKEMSIEDLADEMKVKESVIHRIESGKLKPDEKLAKKLRKALNLKIYKKDSELDYETTSSKKKSSSKATIGDVAKVKKK